MRDTLRHLLAATAIGAAIVSVGPAFAQAGKPAPAGKAAPAAQPAPEQQEITLTQAQIDALLVAQPELAKIQGGDSDKPDPKLQARVEEIAKRNGFASADELGAVSDTIDAVLSGLDPETKSYVGATALIKKDIAEVQANKQMPAKDKAAALKELKAALAAGDGPKPSAANIAIVTKNLDKLNQDNQSAEAGAR